MTSGMIRHSRQNPKDIQEFHSIVSITEGLLYIKQMRLHLRCLFSSQFVFVHLQSQWHFRLY
ncbi:unnamed protein product [Rodentolepis nana]|uniref:Uncharacterized protein n=1 Tax=Rodentolepis nana TaxID=102285 RepID=A0A0R3TAN8_RODNA|nr:unnamed protein product [Rodentolepis nana]